MSAGGQAIDYYALPANEACCIAGHTLGAFSAVLGFSALSNFSALFNFSALLASGRGVNLGRLSYACALLLVVASISVLICSPCTCISYVQSTCSISNLFMGQMLLPAACCMLLQ